MSPLRTLRQMVAPTGRHRLPRPVPGPELIEVRLDDLFGPPLPAFPPAPAHGAIAPQAFRRCLPCGGEVPVVLHTGGAQTCDSGHLTIPTDLGEEDL